MPKDFLSIVAVCVVAMFVVFGAVLIWGDLQTRPKQLAQQSARQTPGVLISGAPPGRDCLQEESTAMNDIVPDRETIFLAGGGPSFSRRRREYSGPRRQPRDPPASFGPSGCPSPPNSALAVSRPLAEPIGSPPVQSQTPGMCSPAKRIRPMRCSPSNTE